MSGQTESYKKDIILGILFLLIGAWIYIMTLNLPEPMYDPLGPAFFPRVLSIGCMICAAVILGQGLRKRHHTVTKSEKQEKEELPYHQHPLTAIAAMALVALYILLMDLRVAGFRILTILFVLVLGALLIRAERHGSLLQKSIVLTVLAVALGVGLYYLFTRVFYVNLP